MKKMNHIIFILCISILAISTWGWANTKACSCGQTPPVDNSIPNISQPTIPSNPSSSNNNTSKEKMGSFGSLKGPLVDYSLLTITKVILKDGRYRIDGITDLPPGTRLTVILRLNKDSLVTFERFVETKNGAFTVFFSAKDSKDKNDDIYVDVTCDPKKQMNGAGHKIDRYGANLVGENSKQIGKVKVLKTSFLYTQS